MYLGDIKNKMHEPAQLDLFYDLIYEHLSVRRFKLKLQSRLSQHFNSTRIVDIALSQPHIL